MRSSVLHHRSRISRSALSRTTEATPLTFNVNVFLLQSSRAQSTLSRPLRSSSLIGGDLRQQLHNLRVSSQTHTTKQNGNSHSRYFRGHRFKSTANRNRVSTIVSASDVSKEDEDEKSTATAVTTTTISGPSTAGKPWLLDLGIPKLIPEWSKMYKTETLFTDITAGLTVGCVAVPLSLAIALSSGVPAEVGLVTAAVAGIAGGLLGGTTLAVTGPAAAISLLVVGAVEQHGLEALPFITLACGGLQMASGITRLGVVAKLVPVSVIAGFTTGVGTLILSGQVPKALGMAAPSGLNPIEILGYIGQHASAINPSSAALALGTSAAMFALPKLHAKMPAALLAVGGATVATHTFGLDVALIGNIPSGLEAFQFGFPSLPPGESFPSLCATTLLIYAMTSVESLLSCAALEKMKKTDYKHSPDQELLGQGVANIGSAFFMGMPVTSVIARSSLNVRANAETRLPALVQSGFVFSSVVFMSQTIAMIPMPALSGMLITTGIGMLNPTEFKHCYAVDKADTLPFLTTVGGMITLGLAEGIGIGCVTALALHKGNWSSLALNKMKFLESRSVNVPMIDVMSGSEVSSSSETKLVALDGSDTHTFQDDFGQDLIIDKDSLVWQLNGPINFISMFVIDKMAVRIQERTSNNDSQVKAIVLDMQGVSTLEFTGVEEMVNRLIEVSDDIPIQMVNCSAALRDALDQCDPSQEIQRFSALESRGAL